LISASSTPGSRRESGKPFREHVGAQRHRRADDRHRQRIADAGGVTAQQIHLQLGERVVRDPHVGEVAEPGVDAVRRRVVVGGLVNDDPRRANAIARHIAEGELLVAVRNRDEIVERERLAVQQNHNMSIPLLAIRRTVTDLNTEATEHTELTGSAGRGPAHPAIVTVHVALPLWPVCSALINP
jgi:hypothetical protein